MVRNVLILLFVCAATIVPSFAQNPLLIPDTIAGKDIRLEIKESSMQLFPGNKTKTFGVNGPILGPTIILNKHQYVNMNVVNALADTTTIHWHGMHVAPENDGGPHIIVLPGKNWTPSFEVLDDASTHWYHPHMHMKTFDHVQMGVAGFIIVRDSTEGTLALPRTYGVDDIPLAVQTKAIDAYNQIITSHSSMDTALFVNGTRNPYKEVPAQVIRLRLLNGSPERVYNFGFADNRTFYQIGTDGGLLKSTLSLTRLMLAPGERAEILVQLKDDQGKTVRLMNFGSQIPNAYYGARQPGMGPGQTITGYANNPLNGADFKILDLLVGGALPNAILSIPGALTTLNPWKEADANTTRNLTFMSMNMGPTAINGPFVINDQHFDMDVINFRIPFNNTEIWELRNQTPIAHPFHIHNVHFYVLTVNGAAPAAHLQGKKDVVLVPAGSGIVRFIAKFTDFYSDSFSYMYHCHMLTHEDDGMMGQFLVLPPCEVIKAQPQSKNISAGNTASFDVAVEDSADAAFQWQSNIGFGFQNLQNAGQYSGVNTPRLTVANVTSANNNQLFRCLITHPKCNIQSDEARLIVGVSGLNPIFKTGLRIYPMPADDLIQVEGEFEESEGQKWLQIRDMRGILHQRVTFYGTGVTVDVDSLLAGLYLLEVMDSGRVYRQKMVIR